MNSNQQTNGLYVKSLTNYERRKTNTVRIGDLQLGSDFPIRVQSMTTTDTMDTMGSVEQIKRMVNAGCELVRLTAPSINEAQNLANIKTEMNKRGIFVPLVADIHFTPNAAEVAARIVEKVRINPGNYADKKKFQLIEYSDADYQEELDRIREKFVPLINICKNYGTALRIGTNHGSLSDRIMSRYGDTAEGMVESAMEFLRIANDEGYHNIVLSMKSSNPLVMVHAYRLLVKTMDEANMHYPLHLGVTEAGDGDDGRIKSALGIGALLEDGIGDTIRVSLTEDPEFEVPVALRLTSRYGSEKLTPLEAPSASLDLWLNPSNEDEESWSPYHYKKIRSAEVVNVGGGQLPRVIADYSSVQALSPEMLKAIGHVYEPKTDKWFMTELGADFIYLGEQLSPFMLPMGLKAIYDADAWQLSTDKPNAYPLFTLESFLQAKVLSSSINFILLNCESLTTVVIEQLKSASNVVLILRSNHHNAMADLRNACLLMKEANLQLPIVLSKQLDGLNLEDAMLFSSTDLGTILIEGFGEGLFLRSQTLDPKRLNDVAFGILQAARVRISKTEYISCPSCGRTLFDLQETTAKIRKRTDHLKGVKIAIMGCIVNGPGEMADADYGYVGSGPDKITLYKGKEVVKKSVPANAAVDELIELIRESGDWTEPA